LIAGAESLGDEGIDPVDEADAEDGEGKVKKSEFPRPTAPSSASPIRPATAVSTTPSAMKPIIARAIGAASLVSARVSSRSEATRSPSGVAVGVTSLQG
jgi:hypothetical protein